MKAIQDSGMRLKQMIAEILDCYATNEKQYSSRTHTLRLPLEYLKEIGWNLTDLAGRYRHPDLILAILRPMETLCFNRAHIVESS